MARKRCLLSGAQTYCEGPTEVGTSVVWKHKSIQTVTRTPGDPRVGGFPTHLGLDDKGPVSADGDLLLHDAEAVEAADEHPGAVQPQGEVHVVAGEALLVVLDVLTAVHIEEEEVVEVAFGEGLPLLGTWR